MTILMQTPDTVFLYVFDRLADWEIGFATAHLNRFDGQFLRSRYRVRTVGESRDPIVTMGGLRVRPDSALDEVESNATALLILPGGLGWDDGGHQAALALAGRLLAARVPVAGICGATAGLARAGFLDARAHTSNHPGYLQATGYAGAAHYRDQRAVTDQGVITAGATGALAFAREIFRILALYPPDVIDAWHGLYETGEARYIGPLMAAAGAGVTSAERSLERSPERSADRSGKRPGERPDDQSMATAR